ncbi:MAG: hypothetical protein IIC60_15145 [Proteobacteria bacterium]|nr:hypothetical protein [Pseudomonadota bacterium]
MRIDYYKKLGRGLTVASIIGLGTLSIIGYHGQAISGSHSGGAGNSGGKGVGNSLGDRSTLIKAENASDMARLKAAHGSAVFLAEFPNHFDDEHTH